jgi:hypothetical protein
MEALADAFSQAPALLFQPHFDALGLEWDPETESAVPKINPRTGKRAKGATLVGFSREGVAKKSAFKDAALQVRVADSLADRLYGKAKVSMEVGANMGVGVVKIPADLDRARQVADILAEVGAIPAEKAPKTGKKGAK